MPTVWLDILAGLIAVWLALNVFITAWLLWRPPPKLSGKIVFLHDGSGKLVGRIER